MAFSIVEQNKILNVLPFDENIVSKTNVNVFVSVVFFFVTSYHRSCVGGLFILKKKKP